MATDHRHLLGRAATHAADFLEGLPDRRVGAVASAADLHAALGGPLPDGPTDPEEVLEQLVKGAEQGLVGTAGPRFFGFVVGGSLPAALAAESLAAAWDQPASAFASSPPRRWPRRSPEAGCASGPQPGAGPLPRPRRRSRRPHPRRRRAGAAGRDLLARRQYLARHGGHAILGVELVDHSGGRGPVGPGHPAAGRRRRLTDGHG